MKHLWPQTDLYAITDYTLSLGRDNVSVARELLDAGIKFIQYREKERDMEAMLPECLAIRQLTKECGATFIVNDHVELALLVDADGVHVGQKDLPVQAVRGMIGPDKLIGLSTHSPEQAWAAVLAGADYIGAGPVYETKTKKDVCAPVGLDYVKYVARNIPIPFTAIGGIKAENVAKVAQAGAYCFAVVSAFVGARDIGAAVREMRAAAGGMRASTH